MKKWLVPASSAAFVLLLCMFPAEALTAASQSLCAWALTVVPALLPYLMATPALTSPEVSSLLARAAGPFLRVLRLPEGCGGALLIGLLSGSPAGASALSACPRSDRDDASSFLRAALVASGASPAFLLSSVAAGMLNAPETGGLLLRSQALSALLTGLIFRSPPAENRRICPLPAGSAPSSRSAASHAVRTLLSIGCCMVCFSTAARLISRLLGPSFETPLLVFLELAGGCRALSLLPAPLELRLPLISAAASVGGLSVFVQSMSFLSPMGISAFEYAAVKLVHAALAACLTRLQLVLSHHPAGLPAFLLLILLLLLLALLYSSVRRRKSLQPAE